MKKVYIIPRSKLHHIKSLVQRAGNFIKQEPTGDKFRNGLAASWALGSTTAFSLLSSIGNPFCKINYILHVAILLSSIAVGYLCSSKIKQRSKDKINSYDSYIEEIKELLESLKEE